MVDKDENRAKRIRHYNNYLKLLAASKIKNNAEMARRIGSTRSCFTSWSTGVSEPNAEKIAAICKVLRCNVNKIID